MIQRVANCCCLIPLIIFSEPQAILSIDGQTFYEGDGFSNVILFKTLKNIAIIFIENAPFSLKNHYHI